MNKKLSIFGILIFLLIGSETMLRALMPGLGADIFCESSQKQESPFLYNKTIGYEFRPSALIEICKNNYVPVMERLNKEGFRGFDYAITKPEGTFRILAVGDSIVQSPRVTHNDTWEKALEDGLRSRAIKAGSNINYEVINAGVGGHRAWQTLLRLQKHGLKYKPDLVLVIAGWNDMLLSTLPQWSAKFDLSRLEIAYAKDSRENGKRGLWENLRLPLYRISYIARLIRKGRNIAWNARYIQRMAEKHKIDSGLEFNKEALELYLGDLEKIYRVTNENGTRMGLITWPTMISSDFLNDRDIGRKAIIGYENYPLSFHELWTWYKRYIDAQRKFAASHPDIMLIDAAEAFDGKNKEERLTLFMDLGHFTASGNREFAYVILQKLKNME